MSALAPLIQSYRRIAPGDRRALLLMFIFLGSVAGYLFLLEPLVLRYQAAQQGLQDLNDRRRGYQQQVRVLAQREARWREHGAELQQFKGHFTLASGDPQGAVARVIPELIDYARLCRVEVSGLRPLDTVTAGDYLELPLEAEIDGRFPDLKRFFYFVDTSPSILAVTDLDLRPQDGGRLRARVKISHVIHRPAQDVEAATSEATVDAAHRLHIGAAPGMAAAPLAVARHNGELSVDGFDIRSVRLDDGAEAARMLRSGTLDGLIASLPELLELHAKGPPLRLVLPLGAHRGAYALVASADSDSREVRDLGGQRIGVDAQGPLPFALDSLLRAVGLPPADTQVQSLRHRLVERELLAGTLRAGILTEPTLSRLLQAGRVQVLAAPGNEAPSIPFFLAVTGKAADQQTEAVQLAVRGLTRALTFIAEQPDQAAQLAADWNGRTVEEADGALTGLHFTAPDRLRERLTGRIAGVDLDDYRAYFAATGKPFPPDSLEGMIEPRFLDQGSQEQTPATGGARHGG